MVKTLVLFLICVVLALVVGKEWQRFLLSRPCATPIEYSIGDFDTRFNLSKADFLSALKEAEKVWEGPFLGEQELFAYVPDESNLKVNLVYDYRQAVTEELGEIEDDLKENEASYRLLETRYRQTKQEYESLKSQYETAVANLEQRNNRYEARIDAWNAGDRTNKSEFESLEAERLSINKEIDALRALENTYNQKVRELNSQVERLNRIGRNLNLNVEEYNTIGAVRGETFEGGIYYSDKAGEGINIYEFSNHQKLIRLLAHELGHALGLDHVEDKEAIMYVSNDGRGLNATAADLAALHALCEYK